MFSFNYFIYAWILFSCVLYLWHYIIEVVLDLPIIGQSPCSAHADLKLLIQRIIQEAIGLPSMKKSSSHPSNPSEINDRTYEDLLATAIINKIVENYQDEFPLLPANGLSDKSSNSSLPTSKEYFFGEETLETKWKNAAEVDAASVSSLDDWVRSDSSTGSAKYVDHRSMTIKQGIKEVSTSDEDEEEVVHVKHKKSNWKENWMLQKRQFTGTASPVPVPMLVPNPTSEAKVLIGDREAEDTSDLSDIGSDYGDTEKAPCVESVLVDSKTVIGGKNIATNLNKENEIPSDDSADTSNVIEESESFLELDDANTTYTIEPVSFDSLVEQDSEYTEKYATLPKTIVKESPSEVPNVSEESSQVTNGYHKISNGTLDSEESSLDKKNDPKMDKQFIGSYSEREKQKWENAVEMKNNPYTIESVNKRLSKSSFTDVSSLYGRDYYIKEASKAAGARKIKAEDVEEMVTPDIQEPASYDSESLNEYIFQAKPIIVIPENLQYTESDTPSEITSPIPLSLLEISSDSDLSIERVYNLNSGKVYENIGGVHKEIVKRSASPEGITYKTNTEFDIIYPDENHNNATLERKRTFLKSLTENENEETEYIIKKDIDSTIEDNNVFSESVSDNGNSSYETIVSESVSIQLQTEIEEHVVENNDKYSIQELSLEFSTDGENRTSPEIDDLKEKHLVKDKLGLFSKSYPNIATVPLKKSSVLNREDSFKESVQNTSEINDTSINNLRKKFDHENTDFIKKEMHSLTARSISQMVKKDLQEIDSNSNNKSVSTEETIIVEQQTNYFPDAKSRIKFFENLNH